MRLLQLIILALLPTFGAAAAPQGPFIVLPKIFSDGMVLQRNTEVPIWGWAAPAGRIQVEASWGAASEAVADGAGRFVVWLPTPDAGGPYQLTVKGVDTVTIHDVLVGEVWFASGQSNMEFPVAQIEGSEEELAKASDPKTRFFVAPNLLATSPRADVQGKWVGSDPETVKDKSAVAWFFARRLREDLNVPVGIIEADWGGSTAEAWMSRGALERFPEFAEILEHLEVLSDPVRRIREDRKSEDEWWSRLDTTKIGKRWLDPSLDDSGWKKTGLPAGYSDLGLADFDGIVYLRRTFTIPEGQKIQGAVLRLGPIDDYDDVAVNGTLIGSTHAEGRWGDKRRYEIPAGLLRTGRNTVAIRALDNAGPGGLTGAPDDYVLELKGRRGIPLAKGWRWHRGPARADLPSKEASSTLNHRTATLLFNAMVKPLAPYGIRGVLWYQGESNRLRHSQYRRLFPALIRDWRDQWGMGDLPFYFVQIAPFRYGGDRGEAALLRDAQREALALPNTGMAVTVDVGDPGNIHPKNKRPVGERLARLALHDLFGRDIVRSGPVYRSAVRDGHGMRVMFDTFGAGLELRESPRPRFMVAGRDRVFHVAKARVEGETLFVWNPHVPHPAAVRYDFTPASAGALYNKEGQPAAPFRSDDWDDRLPPPQNEWEMTWWRSDDAQLKPIFDGKTLDGWKNVNCAPETWTVKDGLIACTGHPTGVLRTTRQYENFVLELEWRHLQPGGNAGLFVWSDPLCARGQPFTRSVECQVMDGRDGGWFTSDGDMFPIHGATMIPENGQGGSRAFPTERRANDSPLWNHYRIEANNGTLTMSVNGKVVTRGHDVSPRKGYICLESEGSPVEFRNLRLKELPGNPELAPKDAAQVAQGFRSLYTGLDFRGWKFTPAHKGHWRAADWTINFDGKGPDLWTTESFKDFVLVCDWRWTSKPSKRPRPLIGPDGLEVKGEDGKPKMVEVDDAGDSGIYLRGNSKSQINIWCWPVGSGEIWGYRTDPKQSPEVRRACTPSEAADRPIGSWNRFVITMVGDEVTVDLNGRRVIDHARLPGVPEEGPIALQRHGAPIQFANLYIRKITGR